MRPNGEFIRYMTATDIANILHVHPKTIYCWVKTSGLPCFRLGNRLRFIREDVLRWVSARREGNS